MKAKGLMSIVLSLPDNWEYSISGLAALSTEKESAVKSALNELKERGYLVVTKKMPNDTKSGRIEYEYTFYEIPEKAKQEQTKQDVENLPLENLPLEILSVENQGQLNTNILNTNIINTNKENTKSISNIPLIPPEEKLELLFDDFWKVYPKKVNKKDAFKAFKSIKNVEQLLPDILADVEMKKNTNDWQRENGRFIPYPASYLRGERWNDVNEIANMQAYQNELVLNDIQNFNLWRNEDDAQ
jgi:hypothetical protein